MTEYAESVEQTFREETDRLTAERFGYGAVTFAVALGIAWVFEIHAHPERKIAYATLYGLEVLTLAAATLLIRWPRTAAYRVSVAVAASVCLAVFVTTYHIWVHGEFEVLMIVLLYLTLGAMVLMPWGWPGQAILGGTALLAYITATLLGIRSPTPWSVDLLALVTITALSVWGAMSMADSRYEFIRQAADLRAANAALARAGETKNTFIASVSHELRTPLNVVVGYTDLLLDNQFGEVPPEIRGVLERVAHNGRSLVYLLSDLVDLARIEAGRLSVQLAPVRLDGVFEDIAQFVTPRMEARTVPFHAEPPGPLMVIADRNRLEQILVNLLSNAVKFTESGEIALRASRSTDSTVAIEVTDTGLGIDANEIAELFEPFSQGVAGQQRGGVGIGLSLCAQLAQAMGGAIQVQSAVGQGSTFTVTLPVAPA